jgi:hypothetical protein
MAIYMVQHSFARPDWEDEWNAWYARNIEILMGVPGFITGQRFKGTQSEPPRYMAMYTVESAAVFESKAYVDAGGNGVNSRRFRPAYAVWMRNLFESSQPAPAVSAGECLVLFDSAEKQPPVAGIAMTWLTSIGFHRTTPYRGLAVMAEREALLLQSLANVLVYRPLTSRLDPLH